MLPSNTYIVGLQQNVCESSSSSSTSTLQKDAPATWNRRSSAAMFDATLVRESALTHFEPLPTHDPEEKGEAEDSFIEESVLEHDQDCWDATCRVLSAEITTMSGGEGVGGG
eukprot:CAMPEP_0173101276 /NCGR_PEP_ID=MMETSP1102-20130122/36736_1 /TAXON_ID=49646 /ORGANISM="Geminigera sp., Strain Caron Lab Isolate" /LENGTH=111 /DNA_ID=CAMNT_0013994945 /DNA_START=157 /DNA_END=489 /DNA_ORIENTATION=-